LAIYECLGQEVANQNKKNKRRQERTTCNPNGNPGPVNKIRTVHEHRIKNAKIPRVVLLIIGLTTGLFAEDSCWSFLSEFFFIRLLAK